jgi:hypothetical protein
LDPIVDLAPGADDSLLAQFFAERIKARVEEPSARRSFLALKSTIFVVDFDSGETISLRFDHGRLTVHEGPIGIPSVTFGGPRRALESLDRVHLGELPGALLGSKRQGVSLVETTEGRTSSPPPSSPPPSGRPRKLDVADLARLFAKKELRVYGLLSHPRTVFRFLKIVRARS